MSVDDVTVSSGNGQVQGPPSVGASQTGVLDQDDVSSAGTSGGGFSSGSAGRAFIAKSTTRSGGNEFETEEVTGDPPTMGPNSEATAGVDEEVSTEGEPAGESLEATPAQLSQESGEESAISDLSQIPGFTESTYEESTPEQMELSEVGTQLENSPEFLPFLASPVPTLISTVGPAIAQGIAGRLSPKTKAVIAKAPAPRPGASPGMVPGGIGALLAQILQLLKPAAAGRTTGGESDTLEAAAQPLVEEAARVIEAIIGADTRVRINNTTDIPWRRIAALKITFKNGAQFRGTAFAIGPRAFVTAGHCVYMASQGGWARTIEVIPGANDLSRPFGSAVSSQFRSVGGWVNGARPESDYGCIVVPAGAFSGRNLGSFGISAMTPQELLAKPAVIAGYPGDKPFAQLWGAAEKISRVNATTIEYPHDTFRGMSGGPCYIKRANGMRTVVGIHNYGGAKSNSATRVTEPVARRLREWSRL